MCKDVFLASITQVKAQCSIVIDMIITKLNRHFVDSKLMNVFGITYPQFWMQPNVDFSFSLHINAIKRHYCELKKVKPSLDQVVKPLNVNNLYLQQSMLEFIMKAQHPRPWLNLLMSIK